MPRMLIKNANILSMDPEVGDFDDADILIEDNKIAAVGPNIEAGDAEVVDGRGRIVTPGLVNAHIHTWEYQLRG
ncbi:5-methylthioadenosine deaminase, partial [Variovorax sp. J31P179]|nr:5-methylthioadenosine deaminase [Variovorax sp. J31P179]